jgi:UrcA family protein
MLAASAISATAFAGTPAPAGALSSASQSPTVRVRYDDLNLSTDQGAAELYKRISRAAREVCPDRFSRDLAIVAASAKCEANAIAQAVRDVNSSRLAMLHATRTGRG